MHIKSNHIELRDKMFAYTEDIEEFKSRMTPLEFERECLIFSGTEAEEIKKLIEPLDAARNHLKHKKEWLKTFTQERFESAPRKHFNPSSLSYFLDRWQNRKKYEYSDDFYEKFKKSSYSYGLEVWAEHILEHFAFIKGWKKIFDYLDLIDREYEGTKKYLIDLRSMDERRQNKESLWQCNDTLDMWFVYKKTGQYVYSRG